MAANETKRNLTGSVSPILLHHGHQLRCLRDEAVVRLSIDPVGPMQFARPLRCSLAAHHSRLVLQGTREDAEPHEVRQAASLKRSQPATRRSCSGRSLVNGGRIILYAERPDGRSDCGGAKMSHL